MAMASMQWYYSFFFNSILQCRKFRLYYTYYQSKLPFTLLPIFLKLFSLTQCPIRRVNFHWQRCMENGTTVGEYGELHKDGLAYRTSFYADSTGYHPSTSRTPLTEAQKEVVLQVSEGVFILPNVRTMNS